MKKPLLTPEAIEELKKYEVGGQVIHSNITPAPFRRSIYIEIEGYPQYKDAVDRVVKRILDENPTLKLAQPIGDFVRIRPFNCWIDIAVGFVFFKKKPIWQRLFRKK